MSYAIRILALATGITTLYTQDFLPGLHALAWFLILGAFVRK